MAKTLRGKADLLHGPVLQNMLRFALPILAGTLLQQLYSMVDAVVVGQFVGKTALAAVGGSAVAIINLLLNFFVGLCSGAAIVVAQYYGAHDHENVSRAVHTATLLAVWVGAIMTVIGVCFAPGLLSALDTPEDTMQYSIDYMRWYFAGMIPTMIYNMGSSILRAMGDSKRPLYFLLLCTGVNTVLDLLCVAVLRLEVAGAAIATGLSQCVGGLFPLIYFLRPNSSKLRLVRTKLELRPILNACGNGSSELMSNISSSIVSMIYNFQLLKYIGEDGISAYGVLMYVQFVFIAIDIGYSIGCAPIVGFHFGAQNHAELKNMLGKSVKLMCGAGVVMAVLAQVLAAPLARLFVGYDEVLYTLTCHAFRLFSFAFLFAGFNIFASSFFTALNNGLISAVISFLRTLVLQTSSVILLPLIFGVDGIWYAITAAEIFATTISVIFLFAKRKKYHYM